MTAADAVDMAVHLEEDVAMSEALVREALAAEGFGVLTEIDVQATLHTKLGVDMPAYRILGACSPQLAYRAISADPAVGLLLPCNVVVREVADGTSVEFANPLRMLDLTDNATLHEVAVDATDRLVRVVAALASRASVASPDAPVKP